MIIPSRDAGSRLKTCLAALAAQRDAKSRFEVIVVDDGSRTPISVSLQTAGEWFPIRIVRRDVSGGPAAARNTGWRAASGQVCLFLDDDVEADPCVVRDHIEAHRGGAMRVGIGRLTDHVPARADWLARAFADAWNAHDAALAAGRPPRASDGYSGAWSAPVELLRMAGGFDEHIPRNEDVDLTARLVELGASLRIVGRPSRHREHKAGPTLLSDAGRNGAVAPRLVARHPWLLADTELGSFAATGQRQLLARRVLARSPLPAEWMAGMAGTLARPGNGGRAHAAMNLLVHHAYWRGVRRSLDNNSYARATDGTAILMYHGFSPSRSVPSRYVTPSARFEAQLRMLLRLGHRPLRLTTYLELRRANIQPPARSFVVTIDDGYAEIETIAAPILRRLGIPATIFLVANAIGGRNGWDRGGSLAHRSVLDTDAIRRLRSAGLEFAAHSAGHANLTGLPARRLAAEVGGAVAMLEDRIGTLVTAFAYPFGAADAAARAAVEDAGLVGLGIAEGLACPASPAASLPRIEVRGSDSPLRLALATRLGGTRRLVRA